MLDGVLDTGFGDFRSHGLFERGRAGLDGERGLEAGLIELSLVLDSSGNEYDGDVECLCFPEQSGGDFAHERLAVGFTLSGDDQVRAFSLLPELERVQKEIDTWAQAGTKKSDQSTTHATCRSGTFRMTWANERRP